MNARRVCASVYPIYAGTIYIMYDDALFVHGVKSSCISVHTKKHGEWCQYSVQMCVMSVHNVNLRGKWCQCGA